MVLPVGPEPSSGQTFIISPSAPPMEAGECPSYGNLIEFIVVNGDNRHVVRTEKKSVLESSVELAKIVMAGPTSGRRNDMHFLITNVDNDDFELMIRYFETKFIKYRDHRHTLKILELADRYNCPDLIINCIKELDLQLTSTTVLDVLQSLWYYNSVSPFPIPSAATESNNSKKKPPSQPFTPEEYMAALLSNSLQLIDMHAELILTNEQVTDLKFQELEMITKRDALQLQSENSLYHCLAEWSLEQTKRKLLDPTDENRRRVLGALIYTPKYLTMAPRDFEKCMERVELLDSGEAEMVRDALNKGAGATAGNSSKNKKSIQAFNQNLSDEQISLLTKFRTPRPAFARMPIPLSDRSNPKNYPKKMRLNEKEELGENSGWADTKCGYVFFSFLACLFD